MPTPTTVNQMKSLIDQTFNQNLGIANSINPVIDGNLLKTFVDFTNQFFVRASEKAAADGVATLDADGKLLTSQLPALSLTETFVVASEVDMLALTAQMGDVAVRTDESKTYILTAGPATTLGNWQELLTVAGGGTVASVNGQTGVVVLSTTNIAEGTNQYFTDGRAITALTGQNISLFTNNAGYITGNQAITLSGDISGTGTTAITTTIGNNKVSNAMLSTVATATFKGRATAGTGNVEDLSVSQVKTLLNLTGTNSGDVTLTGENYITIAGQVITAAAVTLSSTHVTGTLPVSKGGLGVASLTAYAPIFGGTTGTGVVQSGTVGTSGHVLTSNGPGALPTFQAPGTGSPGGTNSQIQYNNSGTLSGISTITTDGSSLTCAADGIGATQTARLSLSNATAATSGIPKQFSPYAEYVGSSWYGGSASVIKFRLFNQTGDNGASNDYGFFTLGSKVGAGAWTDNLLTVNTAGFVGIGSLPAANTSKLIVTGSGSTNYVTITGATTNGVQLDSNGYGVMTVNGSTNLMLLTHKISTGYLGLGANNRTTDLTILATTGHVGINTATPVASAQLEVVSTTAGFLPPRMTTTQRTAISSPAEGLMVYDSTLHKLFVYTTAWEQITSV